MQRRRIASVTRCLYCWLCLWLLPRPASVFRRSVLLALPLAVAAAGKFVSALCVAGSAFGCCRGRQVCFGVL